ncbi:YnfC family lipoprotein [Salmonella enterica]
MKNKILLFSLVTLLAGCDEKKGPVAFTPEMASFSNEFDFDPLRGPVKNFSQTLLNEKGEVAKRVTGTMSKEGCFDTLELHDVENNSVVSLVLDANYYVDAESKEKRLRLQGKCQLAEFPAAGVDWDTDDKGFISLARGKDLTVKYFYDDEGYPLGKTTTSKDIILKVVATPSKDAGKKLDYTAISTLNDKPLGKVEQSCDYDSYNNPVSCRLRTFDDRAAPESANTFSIKNTIEYY